MTKERPILFSKPMVLALRAGRKTQTRRIVKPQPEHRWNYIRDLTFCTGEHERSLGCRGDVVLRCPHGAPGDRLWTRETWAARLDQDHVKPRDLDPKRNTVCFWADPQTCNTGCAGAAGKKRPGIFLPRWASRDLLEVTDVRVQRVQDISEEDAQAEGVEHHWCGSPKYSHAGCCGYVAGYRVLWDQINGAGSWASSPWVWAVSFRRLTP
jgi:hypothetical protein